MCPQCTLPIAIHSHTANLASREKKLVAARFSRHLSIPSLVQWPEWRRTSQAAQNGREAGPCLAIVSGSAEPTRANLAITKAYGTTLVLADRQIRHT